MCGVIGIFGERDVASKLWLGLIAIQHRGQDAAGIITYAQHSANKDGRFYLKKGKGTVQSLFNPQDLTRLKGSIGIGHVRYPTIGAGDPEDAQPFYTNTPFGIAIAHNGNVINYESLRKWLVNKRHRHINTKSDVEIILNVLASELETNMWAPSIGGEKPVFEAVKRVMERVTGSYSCISFIANIGLLAFRDPHGIKPLKFGCKVEAEASTYPTGGSLSTYPAEGSKFNNFCFASESVALDTLGYDEIRDVNPGEAILIDLKGKVISKVIKPPSPRHCIFEYIYFARPDSVLDNVSVYETRLRLGEELAKKIKKSGLKPDVVIPVPDTARATALSLANTLGVPYREGLIKNRYVARTFIMPRDERRLEYVRYKLNPVKQEIQGKKVLLVDDSIVRGTTSKAITSLVRKAGAKKIYFISSCPPLKYPCFYGIDMQTKQDFIAREKSISEIKAQIGVDELIYQSLEGMLRAVGDTEVRSAKNSYCTACFTGNYPTQIPVKEIKRIEKERIRLS
ncbi:amidophosphoribosyltransferase [candidate division WOR-3 bacterium]|nr:amidophosphoribosyltransferase [candidate division WOR-3 bacterium]